MKASMKHPLWTHLPAAAVLGGLVASIVAAWPFPQRMPLHFDFYGRPDRYGSPWEAVIVFSVVLLLLLVGSIALDETWARQETRKRFNWLGLLDELVIGFVGGTGIGAFALVADGKTDFTFPWRMGVMLALAAVPAAAVLEIFRPHQPSEHQPHGEAARVDDLVARIRAGGHWTWWESQNPWLMNLAIGGGGAMILILTIALPVPMPIRILNLVVGTLLIGLCGGMRISLTPERLTVRFGLLSIPVFRVRLENITEAAEQEFSPLADFGGWGIRMNRQMWAFFLRGTRGVRVKTARGKLYLIGSDHPERLAAILRAAMPVLA